MLYTDKLKFMDSLSQNPVFNRLEQLQNCYFANFINNSSNIPTFLGY